MVARSAQETGGALGRIRRLAAMDVPVPASGALEKQVLPGVDDIVDTVQEMV